MAVVVLLLHHHGPLPLWAEVGLWALFAFCIALMIYTTVIAWPYLKPRRRRR